MSLHLYASVQLINILLEISNTYKNRNEVSSACFLVFVPAPGSCLVSQFSWKIATESCIYGSLEVSTGRFGSFSL